MCAGVFVQGQKAGAHALRAVGSVSIRGGVCDRARKVFAAGAGAKVLPGGPCVLCCRSPQLFVHCAGALGCASGLSGVLLLAWVFTRCLPAAACAWLGTKVCFIGSLAARQRWSSCLNCA